MANGIDLSHSCFNCTHGCALSVSRTHSDPEWYPFSAPDQFCFTIQCGLRPLSEPSMSKCMINTEKGLICGYWESVDEAKDKAKLTAEEFGRRMFKADMICHKGWFGETTVHGVSEFNQLPTHLKDLYLKEAQDYLNESPSNFPNCITKLKGDGTCDGKCEDCK